MDASGYRENAPENIQEQDMKNLTSLLGKLDAISEYEIKLETVRVDKYHDPSLSRKISALCKMESWPYMSQPGHAAPLTLDHGAQIEERFLAFLRGFKMNGHMFYRTICSVLCSMHIKEVSINFGHLQLFDLSLANTIIIFFESVQKHLVNAAKAFIKDEIGSSCENVVVKICDLPAHSFLPLKEFWGSPGHYPTEEVDIYCGETSLDIIKSTPAGRITLYNLLTKLFDTFEKGNRWNGTWKIEDVTVDPSSYQVEIIKPFCGECNYDDMHNDIMRCATDIIPEFKCGNHLPAFFGHLQASLIEFIPDRRLNAITWKKFRDFITAHLSLKPPLTRSTFFDNLHEMLQSLGSGAKKILRTILNSTLQSNDWKEFLLKGKMDNPVLYTVYEHNRKKKRKIAQERKAVRENWNKGTNKRGDTATKAVRTGVAEAQQTQALDVKALHVTADVDQHEEDNFDTDATKVFEETREGLLIFSRHVKQHGSQGAKDNKGEQMLQKISEIDLVTSHYLETLIEIVHVLIYNIDCEEVDRSSPDYEKFLVMFEEIFEEYNAPEALPNRQVECENLKFLEHLEHSCHKEDLIMPSLASGSSMTE